MQMIELENFKILGISLAIGLLIGMERGWHTRDLDEGMRVAGLRTYGLISLLGGLWGILAEEIDPLLMGFAFLGLTSVLLLAYSKSLKKFEDFSITGIIASLITFVLGALTAFGHIMLASASAVIITSLLGFKPLLHGWLKKLEQQELYATLKQKPVCFNRLKASSNYYNKKSVFRRPTSPCRLGADFLF